MLWEAIGPSFFEKKPVSRGKDYLQFLIALCSTFSAARKDRKNLEMPKAPTDTYRTLFCALPMAYGGLFFPWDFLEVRSVVTTRNGILENTIVSGG